jgi:uncharacterized membrane protein
VSERLEPIHFTERESHYKRRLEAFSDIVFGLSLSELALQLGLPAKASGLIDHPMRYAIFFASFAIICSLWVAHHRMFRTFKPTRFNVFLNFVYLAFTVLMPFGMQSLIKFSNSPIGLGIYAICYAITMATICLLQAIGFRDFAARLDATDRADLLQRIARSGAITAVMVVALVLLPLRGAGAAGASLFLIAPAMVVVRRALPVPKRAPEAH